MVALRYWAGEDRHSELMETLKKRPLLGRLIGWVQEILTSGGTRRSIEGDDAPGRTPPSEGVGGSNQSIQRLRDNQATIREVLNFWFGSGTPEKSQSNLWMIASSSHKLRLKVDREITDNFEPLMVELAKGDESDRWKDWCLDEDGIYGMHGKIAAIVVLDQFSRHIQRHHETHGTNSPHQHEKALLDGLALKTARLFVDAHKNEIRCGMVPLPMHIFALMPFRHASTIETLEYVQQSIEASASMHEQKGAMLGRFRKATNRRLAVLQDEARRTGKLNSSSAGATASGEFDDEAILETFAFEADMEPAKNHLVHKVIATFLTDQAIRRNIDGLPTAVIISLSGGVDSMVIASVLSHINKACGYNLKIMAGTLQVYAFVIISFELSHLTPIEIFISPHRLWK